MPTARERPRRLALPLVVAATIYACNVYTEDLLGDAEEPPLASGGTDTGGAPASGGRTGGQQSTGGKAGDDSGGRASGGEPGTGSAGSGGGGGKNTGGAPTGGASGGMAGASATGGARTGGDNPGGVPGGGADTGGAMPGGAGSAGGAPTGGVGTGGAPTGGAPTGGVGTGGLPPGFTAIDMLDEVNNTIELSDGEGLWYTFHDNTAAGVISPDTQRTTDDLLPVTLPAPRDGSLLAVHVTADTGFTSWGSGVGFNLNAPSEDVRLKYDVSRFSGVVFWARAGTGTASLRFKVVTADITPNDESGGECATDCGDTYGAVIDLTTTWVEYTIRFADLAQEGWGAPPPAGFDPTGVLAIHLHAGAGVAFDIWLDDLRFYE